MPSSADGKPSLPNQRWFPSCATTISPHGAEKKAFRPFSELLTLIGRGVQVACKARGVWARLCRATMYPLCLVLKLLKIGEMIISAFIRLLELGIRSYLWRCFQIDTCRMTASSQLPIELLETYNDPRLSGIDCVWTIKHMYIWALFSSFQGQSWPKSRAAVLSTGWGKSAFLTESKWMNGKYVKKY